MTTFIFNNDAASTLAGSISAGATSLTVATGTGVLFPAPAGGQQFAITLYKTATPATYEIVYCTARTADVLTIVRAQEGTSALAWAVSDNVAHFLTAGQMAQFAQNPLTLPNQRTQLAANTTYYVATTGNDSTGTGLIGAPWLTIGKAISYIQQNIDLGGFTATVSCATGAYNAALAVNSQFTGSGTVIIQGNVATPANCTITVTGANDCLSVQNGGVVRIQGFTLASARYGLFVGLEGVLNFQNIAFGACVDHMHSNTNGNIQALGPYSVVGNASGAHANAFGGQINLASATITLTGNPSFGTFAQATALGTIFVQAAGGGGSMSFVGTCTGQAWSASYLGYVDSNGSSATMTATGLTVGTPAINTLGTTGGIAS